MNHIKIILLLFITFIYQDIVYGDYFKVHNFKDNKVIGIYKFSFNIDIPVFISNKENKYVQKIVEKFYKSRLDLDISTKKYLNESISFKNYEQNKINYYIKEAKKYKNSKEDLEKGIIIVNKFSEEFDNGVIYSFKVAEKYDENAEHSIEGGTFNIKKKKEIFAHELFGTDEENVWTHFSNIKEALDSGYQKIAPKGSCKSLKAAIATNADLSPDDSLGLAPIDRPLGIPLIFTKDKELYFWGVNVREDTDKPWTCESLKYEMAWPISYDWLKKIADKNNPLTPYVN